jgi:uncharacterized iron-regulated membrane protein
MDRKKHAALLRSFRKIHRILGAFLFLFFILVAVTALLLGWKKNSNGALLPHTLESTSVTRLHPIGLDSVQTLALTTLAREQPGLSTEIDRIDVRPDKGVAKVTFTTHYWEIQVDLYKGRVLQLAKRRSDFIENLHDGSIFDKYFGTNGDIIKLLYTSLMGLALLTFSITGFWLWYGPKVMRRNSYPKP